MTNFTPRLISLNSRNVLVFNFSQLGAGRSSDEISKLPDERAIQELFSPWLGNPPNEYHIKNYINLKYPSENSILTCQNYSNWAINNIFLHYSDPLHNLIPHGEILRTFCEENRIPYEYVEYYLLARKYFEKMSPTPIDSKILPSFSAFINSHPISSQSDSVSKAYEKVKRHQKVLSERFALYRRACQQTDLILKKFEQSDLLGKAKHLIIEAGDTASKRDNKIRNDKRRSKSNENIIPVLPNNLSIRQCLFCGEFYQFQKSRDNNYSRYCDDPNCKKSYEAWRQALKRKGETTDSVGL